MASELGRARPNPSAIPRVRRAASGAVASHSTPSAAEPITSTIPKTQADSPAISDRHLSTAFRDPQSVQTKSANAAAMRTQTAGYQRSALVTGRKR